MDAELIMEAAGRFGLAIIMAVGLWYALLVPRKDRDGNRKSALLVPGWQHDEAVDRAEQVRMFYEVALKDEQERANVRISEWRGFRDEAVAKQTDAEEDRRKLLDAVTGLGRDVALLLEIQRMAEGDRTQRGDQDRAVRQ